MGIFSCFSASEKDVGPSAKYESSRAAVEQHLQNDPVTGLGADRKSVEIVLANELSSEVRKLSLQVQTLQAQLKETQSELREKNRQLDGFQAKSQELEASRSQQASTTAENANGVATVDLESQLAALKDQLDAAVNENKILKDKQEELEECNSNLNAHVSANQKRAEELHTLNITTLSSATAANEQLSAALNENEILTHKRKSLDDINGMLQEQLAASERRQTELESMSAAFCCDVSAMQDKLLPLPATSASIACIASEELERLTAVSEGMVQAVEETLAETRQLNASLKEELKSANNKLQQLSHAHMLAQKELEDLLSREKVLVEENEQLAQELANVKSMNESTNQSIMMLLEDHQRLKKDFQHLSSQMTVKDQMLELLQHQMSDLADMEGDDEEDLEKVLEKTSQMINRTR